MTRLRRFTVALVAGVVGLAGLDIGEQLSLPGVHSFISTAEAVVGRPLTPVSYAGVARRTSRRVARRTAVRLSTLPAGCAYGSYYGGYYYNCGGAYYEKSGNVYIQVVFD